MPYDKRYFDKWYRSDKHKVRTPGDFRRLVEFVLHAAEYLLNHPVRTVLDVGAGEGDWHDALKKLRPRIRYWGVDISEYAVNRYGHRRNIHLGSAENLDAIDGLPDGVDLVICSSVLNYLDAKALPRALRQLAGRADGVAFLELYTQEDFDADLLAGDTEPMSRHPAGWYRRHLRRAGFISCGMHCYVTSRLESRVIEMERGA